MTALVWRYAGLDRRRRAAASPMPESTSASARTGVSLSSDTRGWFLASVALVLSGNLLFSRYLFWDTYYDLYAGRYIAAHGIPQHNVVTVAAHGAPWIDQQWLGHLAYYAAWWLGGYPALALFSAALVTAGFAILSLLMLRRGVPPVRAFAWTLGAFVACMGNTVIRAQSFGFLFCGLLLWLLLDDDASNRPRKRTLLVLPLLALWANVHGSVLMGIGLVGAYGLYQLARAAYEGRARAALPYVALGAVSPLSVLCTPYGLGIVKYYTSLIGNATLSRNIVEWARPSLMYPVSWGFFALLAAALAVVARSWRRGTRPDPLLLVFAAALLALALTGVRFQAWFAFAGALLAAETAARSAGLRAPTFSIFFRRAIVGMAATMATASLGVVAFSSAAEFESEAPRHAIDVAAGLASRAPGLTILGDEWSGTAAMWLQPTTLGRVGFDARLEQYADRDLSAYFDFLDARGTSWQRAMKGYQIVVASRRKDARLTNALSQLPEWHVAYHDSEGIVIIRDSTWRTLRSAATTSTVAVDLRGRLGELGLLPVGGHVQL